MGTAVDFDNDKTTVFANWKGFERLRLSTECIADCSYYCVVWESEVCFYEAFS